MSAQRKTAAKRTGKTAAKRTGKTNAKSARRTARKTADPARRAVPGPLDKAKTPGGARRLTDRQEAFVQLVVGGMPQAEAYRKTYTVGRSSEAVVAKNASATLAKQNVRARYEQLLAEVRRESARRGVMEAADVLAALSEIAADEDGAYKTPDRLKALELLGKYHALFTDRHQMDGGGLRIELVEMDDTDTAAGDEAAEGVH